ncbi:MAG: NAD(P)/FAD-dependent oxidoreductase [Anaerolineaceae bacterium]|nr:NAD(P)/FAD-dependent oxidoreductase [Anaerolineaceae bacterium]
MKTEHFKHVVIGAGSGGITVAIGLANLGRPVALIEALHVGGDCTNVGCVPSKTLINLAKEYRPGDDVTEVLAEVTRKRNQLRDKETKEMQHYPNIDFIQGRARFNNPKELEVTVPDGDKRLINAEHIVIATGARPRLLDIPGLPEERTLTNESLFDITDLPRHLVIMGAGIIAVEMAFAFQKLGSRVTLIALDERVLPTYPAEVAEAMQPELEKRGINVHLKATSDHYEEESKTLFARRQDELFPIQDVDQVLIAIGRARNIDQLDLEKAGIAYDRNGIQVDGFGRTNVKGVYAIGDVTPTSAFTHSANAQGRRVVQKILFPYLPASKKEPLFPTATYSDPEIATVGLTRKQVDEKCHPDLIMHLRFDLKDLDRGYTDDIQNGFILVDVVRLTGTILGATIVAPHASEMISFFTLAINQRISMYKLYRQVYPYPTFSNGIQKIADAFMRETLPNLLREIKTYLRYRFF